MIVNRCVILNAIQCQVMQTGEFVNAGEKNLQHADLLKQ